MLEGGADIRYIQAMLGHAELSTTQIYAQVSIRALQAVHEATHPGATNQRHRTVPELLDGAAGEFSTDPVGGDPPPLEQPDSDVMTTDLSRPVVPVVDEVSAVEVLFSVLEQEIDQENRADPGSPDPTLPRRRSR